MLELNKLTGQVADMAEALAGQQRRKRSRTELAREKLAQHALKTAALGEKLARATEVDASWRGADPLGDRLDERCQLPSPAPQATLIASDGSQIYPDAHGIAFYFLTNVGTIVLRQGSGQAPDTGTEPILALGNEDVAEESDQDGVDVDDVNLLRSQRELQALADLAWAERASLGGDLDALLIALTDGPILPWMPQRLTDAEQGKRITDFIEDLGRLQQARAVPLGYIDRPRSANVLRLLHLADLNLDEITKEQLRKGSPFRGLADRALFQDLLPGQRTGLFAATSEINRRYQERGQRIFFCYLNVAGEAGEQNARIIRVETPEWVARSPELLDAVLAAVWADCRLGAYPYVLTRAHELALVTRHERSALEQMLRVEMLRRGLPVEESAKALEKRRLSGR